MITYPLRWGEVGKQINVDGIEKALLSILAAINVSHLSLSGGVDSSLMLYYMTLVLNKRDIHCYTITSNEQHPDYIFSKKITDHFGVEWYPYIPDSIPGYSGDDAVKCFYDYLKDLEIDTIIACDGIDEYMGGYYRHQNNPSEEVYYECIRELQEFHLGPLNKNSGNVKVYLPYLDARLISLFSQIPLVDKVDRSNRKKIVMEMAKNRIPDEIIQRRKYGFCDAMKIKPDGMYV